MKLSLDALPLTKNILESNDYNSILVYSAICDPLFKFNGKSIINNACKNFTISKNGKLYTFIIRNDLFYNNGTKVTAIDYQKSIKSIINSYSPTRFILSNIKNIECENNELKIYLHKSDYQFYKILSKINFTPYKNYLTSGLYYIYKQTNKNILLKPNVYHRLYKKRMKEIEFILVKNCDKEINLYTKKCIDITSNTSFHHKNILNYKNNIHKYPSFITMSLSFISKDLLKRKNLKLRKILLYNINRTIISKKFNNIICPTDKYTLIKPIHDLFNPIKNKKIYKITVGYDNFYPNKEILKTIVKQLKEYGIIITPIKDDFFNPKFNYDIKLSLSYPDYIDDIAFYRSAYIEGLVYLSKTNRLYFSHKLKKLYKNKYSAKQINIINNLILKQALIIPLFFMNSIYLSNSEIFSFKTFNYEDLF